MQAYQAGEALAFNELYARYSGKVYSYVANRVFNKNERDDLFQAIFLKFHKSRHLYSSQFLFAPWLFTICRTSLLDYLKLRKPEVLLDSSATDELSEESTSDSALVLSEALSKLSDQQRNAIEMRYSEGLEFSEIAKRLSLSPSNVRQIISRAVRKIRRKP